MMHTWTVILTLTLAQPAPVPMVNPPTLEVTVARVQQVEANIAEIQKLREQLQKISAEIKEQGEQNVDEYVKNAEEILKTRAVLLIKMRNLCASALDAKYALEATLDDYNQWLTMAQELSKQKDLVREQRIKDLRKKADQAEQEFYIVAGSLQRMLTLRKDSLKDTEANKAELAKINDRLVRLGSYFEAIKRSNFRPRPDAELQKRYDNYEVDKYPELEKKLEELDQEFSDSRYEAEFIERNVLGSSSNLLNKLGTARKEQLEKARVLLKESQKLETIATEVSIASRYVAEMLVDISAPVDIANRAIHLEEKLAIEQEVGKSLREITGVGRRSIWDRLSPIPMAAAPEKPPTEK